MKSTIDTFVFLTPRAINSYEENKWSFDYLRNQGYAVKVINLDGIIDKSFKASLSVINLSTSACSAAFFAAAALSAAN